VSLASDREREITMREELSSDNQQGVYLISLKGNETATLSLENLSQFLYEFNVLYEMVRIVVDPAYEDFQITQWTSARTRNRLKEYDKLQVTSFSINSPLNLKLKLNASKAKIGLRAIEIVITAIGLFPIHQGHPKEIEGSSRTQYVRQSIAAPNSVKIELTETNDAHIKESLEIRQATKHFEREKKRLSHSPLQIDEVTITYTREVYPQGEK